MGEKMAFSTKISADPSVTDPTVVKDLQAALNEWSALISGIGTVTVSLKIGSTNQNRAETASGGSVSTGVIDSTTGKMILESAADYKLRTGQQAPGTSVDFSITIDPFYLNTLFIDPDPGHDAVEANKIDLVQVFAHEIGHGLGITGFYASNGQNSGSVETMYDRWITFTNGLPYFTGPHAEAVYGGPVPLTFGGPNKQSDYSQNMYHLANLNTDRLGNDLMTGAFFPAGNIQVSAVDAAIIEDISGGLRERRPESPNNTVLDFRSGKSIVDANGNSWTISNFHVAVNGIIDTTTAQVVQLAYENGLVWQENNNSVWRGKKIPTDKWAPDNGTAVSPIPSRFVSPDNTVVTITGQIVDYNQNIWSIVNGQVAVNGVIDQSTAQVVTLAFENGKIWQANAQHLWRAKTLPTDHWSPANGTTISPIPPTTNESISPSPDNSVVTAPGQSIVDADHNIWTISLGSQVAVNGVVDNTTSSVIRMAYEKGRVWQENVNHLWWAKTLPSDAWWPDQGTTVSPIRGSTPLVLTSPDNTVISTSDATIVDSLHNEWTIVNGNVAVNGVVDPNTGSVVYLAYEKGRIWQENANHLWWSKGQPSDVWSPGLGTSTSPVPSGTELPPVDHPKSHFQCQDNETHESFSAWGNKYSGPVVGIEREFVQISSHNLNVTSDLANVFIHTGSGTDAIDVSKVNGDNVLDGSTGSNFLVGGLGNDTFFVDDRAAPADIWSTVVNFHSGDAATIFGVTQAGFNLSWVNGLGATGFTGLTLVATAPGRPTASLTLAGFTSADLTNGKLAVSFGVEPDGSGPFMFVHGS